MALDEELVERVRRALATHEVVDERKMFGGIGFLVDGNVTCAVVDDDLVVRIGPDEVEAAIEHAGVGLFEINGQAMPGFVVVAADHVDDLHGSAAWVKRGTAFVATLPPKEGTSVPKTTIRSKRPTRRG
jgi:hypothetical protein